MVLESTQALVLLVDVERLRPSAPAAGLALGDGVLQRLAAELGGEIDAALAVLRLERIDPDDRRHTVADLLERARAWPAAIGMHREADVLEVFPFEQVGDVGDVGVEHHLLAQEMRAVGDPVSVGA